MPLQISSARRLLAVNVSSLICRYPARFDGVNLAEAIWDAIEAKRAG